VNYYLVSFDRSDDTISDISKWAQLSVQLEAEGTYSILAGPIIAKRVVMDCVADWIPPLISECKYICAKD
jgi:hypothetical protein